MRPQSWCWCHHTLLCLCITHTRNSPGGRLQPQHRHICILINGNATRKKVGLKFHPFAWLGERRGYILAKSMMLPLCASPFYEDIAALSDGSSSFPGKVIYLHLLDRTRLVLKPHSFIPFDVALFMPLAHEQRDARIHTRGCHRLEQTWDAHSSCLNKKDKCS